MDAPSYFFLNSEGFRFRVRPIEPSDKDLLQRGFKELSERSQYLRFFKLNNKLSDVQLKYFTEVDGIQHVAWGILDESGEESIPVGIGRFVKFKDEQDVAEVAISIIDSYQRKGLGQILYATLNIVAGQIGLEKFRTYVLSENRFVLNSLKKFGILNQKNEGPVTIVDIKVIPNHQAIPDETETQNFIAAMKKIEEQLGLSKS
jgi:RimJ/RimL family protein N-acetyltransferase